MDRFGEGQADSGNGMQDSEQPRRVAQSTVSRIESIENMPTYRFGGQIPTLKSVQIPQDVQQAAGMKNMRTMHVDSVADLEVYQAGRRAVFSESILPETVQQACVTRHIERRIPDVSVANLPMYRQKTTTMEDIEMQISSRPHGQKRSVLITGDFEEYNPKRACTEQYNVQQQHIKRPEPVLVVIDEDEPAQEPPQQLEPPQPQQLEPPQPQHLEPPPKSRSFYSTIIPTFVGTLTKMMNPFRFSNTEKIPHFRMPPPEPAQMVLCSKGKWTRKLPSSLPSVQEAGEGGAGFDEGIMPAVAEEAPGTPWGGGFSKFIQDLQRSPLQVNSPSEIYRTPLPDDLINEEWQRKVEFGDPGPASMQAADEQPPVEAADEPSDAVEPAPMPEDDMSDDDIALLTRGLTPELEPPDEASVPGATSGSGAPAPDAVGGIEEPAPNDFDDSGAPAPDDFDDIKVQLPAAVLVVIDEDDDDVVYPGPTPAQQVAAGSGDGGAGADDILGGDDDEQVKNRVVELSKVLTDQLLDIPCNPRQTVGDQFHNAIRSYTNRRYLMNLHANLMKIPDEHFKSAFDQGKLALTSIAEGSWLEDDFISKFTVRTLKDLVAMHPDFKLKLFDATQGLRLMKEQTPGRKFKALSRGPILMPINKGGGHWYLAWINPAENTIDVLDSLNMTDVCNKTFNHIKKLIKVHLVQENGEEDGAAIFEAQAWKRGKLHKSIPRQENGYDCGLFVCLYAAGLMYMEAATQNGEPVGDIKRFFNVQQSEMTLFRFFVLHRVLCS